MTEKPTKPPYGAPDCNGCGLCCQRFLCPLASMVFQAIDGPCPALEDVGARYVCGLVEHSRRYAPVRAALVGPKALTAAAQHLIGVGVGCDTQDDDEPDNPEYRKAMRRGAGGRTQHSVGLALIAWLGVSAERRVAEFQAKHGGK